MARLAWSQLRFAAVRVVALLAGLLLATTAFTVLTAASRTAQLRTVGTVSSHFLSAYQILVRPKGARTALEEQTGTVQPNFLAGIYGGITMAQYHQIASLPGVSVAAPIAMVGYALVDAAVPFAIPAADYRGPGRHLFRDQTTWVSDNGTSRVTQPANYTYVTPGQLQFNQSSADMQELVPGHGAVTVCPNRAESPAASPFGIAYQSTIGCWSKVDGYGSASGSGSASGPVDPAYWVIPVLIAAIDPAAEAKLDGLNRAVVSGHYLAERANTTPQDSESELPGAGVFGQRHGRVRGHHLAAACRAADAAGHDRAVADEGSLCPGPDPGHRAQHGPAGLPADAALPGQQRPGRRPPSHHRVLEHRPGPLPAHRDRRAPAH